MNHNGNNSGKPFNPADSFPNFRGPIVPEVAGRPDFQRFPTVEELLDVQNPHPFLRLAPSPPPRPASFGLLQELLGGRLDVLVTDAALHPDRYDADTKELLQALGDDATKMQKLDPTEQQILNRAVIDYAAFKPRAAPPPPRPAPKPKQTVLEKMEYGDEEDEREPGKEEQGPGNVLSKYWWL